VLSLELRDQPGTKTRLPAVLFRAADRPAKFPTRVTGMFLASRCTGNHLLFGDRPFRGNWREIARFLRGRGPN
jgi:hypothetical protein